MTSDGPLQHMLHQTAGGRWINDDVESESGGGIVPITYKRTNPINATMWLTGLELFLLIDDPWRVYLTTDHPNAGPSRATRRSSGCSWTAPTGARSSTASTCAPAGARCCPSSSASTRSNEIAIISRAGPARALGLERKGHLGAGADADIAIYAEQDDKEAMFARPRYVFKDGVLVVRDGQRRGRGPGAHLLRRASVRPRRRGRYPAALRGAYTVEYENYAMLSAQPAHTGDGRLRVRRSSADGPGPSGGIRRDVQRERPAVPVALSRAGVTDLHRIISIKDGGKAELFYATLDLFADLDREQTGVHMSRFSEVVEDLAEGLTSTPFPDIETLARRMAERVLETQEALRAEVRIRAQTPIVRRTPVTQRPTEELYTLVGIAAATAGAHAAARRRRGPRAHRVPLRAGHGQGGRGRPARELRATTRPRASASSISCPWRRTTSGAGARCSSAPSGACAPRTSSPSSRAR
jgi:hypothetical protein